MKKRYLFYLPVVLTLVISLFVFKDYGIAWDEPFQRELGQQSWQYIFDHDHFPLDEYKEDFGVAYELILIGVEKLFSINDQKEIYEMRHLVSHLLFLIAAFCFFLFIRRLFNSNILAMFAYSFLVLTPEIYAHSFFNSKDLPFLSLLIICCFLIEVSIRKKQILLLIMSAIIAGIMVNVRIMGLLPVIMLMVYIPCSLIIEGNKNRKAIIFTLTFFISFVLIFYLLWPYLWEDPVNRFLLFIRKTSQIPWPGKVLFWGQFYSATELPERYALVWICISTPIIVLSLFLIGSLSLILSIIKEKLPFFKNQTKLFVVYAFFMVWIPLFAVFAMNAVLYDSWRHLFFIYPFIITLGIFGLQRIFNLFKDNKLITRFIWSFMILGIAYQVFFMIKSHPNEQVYVNHFVPRKGEFIRFNFDQDYWGTSFKQAFEHIAKTDKSDSIVVVVTTPPGEFNLQMLPLKERSRFFFTIDFTKADYFLTNYRETKGDFGLGKPWWSIEINRSKIMSVWNFKESRQSNPD